MFVTLHSAAALSVALPLAGDSWPLALLIGWLGHFALDAIPHGDEASEETLADPGRIVRRAALMGGIDLLILGSLSAVWLWQQGWSWAFVAAVTGSVLPDAMWGIAAVLQRPKLWGLLGEIHRVVHNPIKFFYPLWVGLPLQTLAAGLLWAHLLR